MLFKSQINNLYTIKEIKVIIEAYHQENQDYYQHLFIALKEICN
jgi:hypothetical protein